MYSVMVGRVTNSVFPNSPFLKALIDPGGSNVICISPVHGSSNSSAYLLVCGLVRTSSHSKDSSSATSAGSIVTYGGLE